MSPAAEVLPLLYTLLSHPSPQPELERVRAFIRDVVRPLLAEAPWDRVELDPAGNLVAWLEGPNPLLVLAYGATYPEATMADAYPARQVEGAPFGLEGPCARGRGAAEQRSGLAAAIWAANRFARAGRPSRGLTLSVCIAGEMGSHDVVEELLRGISPRPACAVLAVATDNGVCLGNKGRVDLHVRVHGRSCHSSDPESGLNAVDGAVAFLQRLQHAPLPEPDLELGPATLAVTAIDSEPKASHTIPSLCRLTLDRRLLPGEDPHEVAGQIAALTQDLNPWTVDVQAGKVNLPNKVAPEAPIARELFAAVAEAGIRPRTFYRKSALDAGPLTRAGAPAVMFGPGAQRFAHTDDELVPEADVVAAANAYLALIERLCG